MHHSWCNKVRLKKLFTASGLALYQNEEGIARRLRLRTAVWKSKVGLKGVEDLFHAASLPLDLGHTLGVCADVMGGAA